MHFLVTQMRKKNSETAKSCYLRIRIRITHFQYLFQGFYSVKSFCALLHYQNIFDFEYSVNSQENLLFIALIRKKQEGYSL